MTLGIENSYGIILSRTPKSTSFSTRLDSRLQWVVRTIVDSSSTRLAGNTNSVYLCSPITVLTCSRTILYLPLDTGIIGSCKNNAALIWSNINELMRQREGASRPRQQSCDRASFILHLLLLIYLCWYFLSIHLSRLRTFHPSCSPYTRVLLAYGITYEPTADKVTGKEGFCSSDPDYTMKRGSGPSY